MAFLAVPTTRTLVFVTATVFLGVAFFFQETLNSITSFGITDPFSYFIFSYSAPVPLADLTAVPHDPSCTALRDELPGIVHLPGEERYNHPVHAYWSIKAQSLLPSCLVKPSTSKELSTAIKVLKGLYTSQSKKGNVDQKVRFAVRSGGHMPEVGFASIDGGVLIDLRNLDSLHVAADRKTVTIGVGSRWGPVYSRLEEVGLTVAGGRDGHVGVGGLSLGGGISVFSPQVGMVSDNILEYEVVLADGSIIAASQTENTDIWRALKGGAGNFGIVTKVVAEAFPSTDIWGGYVYWTAGQTDKLLTELHEFVKPQNFDQHAAGPILAFGYVRMFGLGLKMAASSVIYTKPEAWPRVWRGFQSIRRIWSTVKVRTLSNIADEFTSMSPSGKRQFQTTMTIKNDLETIRGLHSIYTKSLDKVSHIHGVGRCIVFQPLTPKIIHKGTPNSLGLESRNASDPLIIVLITQAWTLESDDELVERTTLELLHDMQVYATEKGTADRYIYMNYAASKQDVIASYGEENHRFLREVSRKYDPDGFWQHARQGGHKLGLA